MVNATVGCSTIRGNVSIWVFVFTAARSVEKLREPFVEKRSKGRAASRSDGKVDLDHV